MSEYEGEVVTWFGDRKYGFILCQDPEVMAVFGDSPEDPVKLFFHQSDCLTQGSGTLWIESGTLVSFKISEAHDAKKKRPRALGVHLASGLRFPLQAELPAPRKVYKRPRGEDLPSVQDIKKMIVSSVNEALAGKGGPSHLPLGKSSSSFARPKPGPSPPPLGVLLVLTLWSLYPCPFCKILTTPMLLYQPPLKLIWTSLHFLSLKCPVMLLFFLSPFLIFGCRLKLDWTGPADFRLAFGPVMFLRPLWWV